MLIKKYVSKCQSDYLTSLIKVYLNDCNIKLFAITFIVLLDSLGCREMYGLPDSSSASRGSETRALCTSEYSEMTPLTGGNVLFSTLEGRPSAHDFDNSPELQVS